VVYGFRLATRHKGRQRPGDGPLGESALTRRASRPKARGVPVGCSYDRPHDEARSPTRRFSFQVRALEYGAGRSAQDDSRRLDHAERRDRQLGRNQELAARHRGRSQVVPTQPALFTPPRDAAAPRAPRARNSSERFGLADWRSKSYTTLVEKLGCGDVVVPAGSNGLRLSHYCNRLAKDLASWAFDLVLPGLRSSGIDHAARHFLARIRGRPTRMSLDHQQLAEVMAAKCTSASYPTPGPVLAMRQPAKRRLRRSTARD